MLLALALLAEPVPVSIYGVENLGGSYNAILVDTIGERFVLIGISEDQALSLRLGLYGMNYIRPLTHDLFMAALDSVGWKVSRVVITKLDAGVFYSDLYLSKGKKTVKLDARPSDALCLAARAHCPVFVEEKVLDDYIEDFMRMLKDMREGKKDEGIGI
ncbi:MAG: bifunctional nuclease family protein [candidate division WOR-3 bacterium]